MSVATIDVKPTDNRVALERDNTPESLLALAIERGLQVDAIERLMCMAKEVRAERARAAFIEAMASFQAACPVIQKTRAVLNKDGKSERYKYAAMEDIKAVIAPHLEANGLSFSFDTQVENNIMSVMCKVQHRDGHSEISSFGVPLGGSTFMSAQQNFASTLTYAKRYALCNSLGLVVGDEDNDGADSRPTPQQNAQPAKPAAKQAPPMPPQNHNATQRKNPPITQSWRDAVVKAKSSDRLAELFNSYSNAMDKGPKDYPDPQASLKEFGELCDLRKIELDAEAPV